MFTFNQKLHINYIHTIQKHIHVYPDVLNMLFKHYKH